MRSPLGESMKLSPNGRRAPSVWTSLGIFLLVCSNFEKNNKLKTWYSNTWNQKGPIGAFQGRSCCVSGEVQSAFMRHKNKQRLNTVSVSALGFLLADHLFMCSPADDHVLMDLWMITVWTLLPSLIQRESGTRRGGSVVRSLNSRYSEHWVTENDFSLTQQHVVILTLQHKF